MTFQAIARRGVWVLVLAMTAAFAGAAETGFALKDTPGDHLDVTLDGKLVARYMYAHDTSTPERRLETYKPYLHVYAADGTTALTKGPGGLFTHHRGLFIGWNGIKFNGHSFDRWHMHNGDMVHQKFLAQHAGADSASFTALINWDGDHDGPIIVEERTITVRRGPAPARIAIDFESKLEAPRGDIGLNDDPEHSGVQFRPSNDVEANDTVYLYPKADANPHKDRDYPWVGETFVLHGEKHSVVDLNPPTNPKHARWSAYRGYGRFGCTFKTSIKKGDSLSLRYRFLIADGPLPTAAQIQAAWDAFAGVATASPVPDTTLKPATVAFKPKPSKKKK